MTWGRGEPAADVRCLLELERPVPSISAETRARMLARVRASLAAEAEAPPSARRAAPLVRWAAIAGIVCLSGAVGALTAYEFCLRRLSH